MRIGIDIDGVLAGQIEGTLPWFNQYLGTNYTKDDWDHWFFMEEQVGREALLRVFDNVWIQGQMRPQELDIPGALKRIRKYGSVTIITARSYDSHPAVIKYLQQWGITYDNFVFVGKGSKLDYPIDVLIDDHPDISSHMNYYPDKTLIIRNQPWNYNDTTSHANVYRIRVLAEAEMILKNIKENYD